MPCSDHLNWKKTFKKSLKQTYLQSWGLNWPGVSLHYKYQKDAMSQQASNVAADYQKQLQEARLSCGPNVMAIVIALTIGLIIGFILRTLG